MFSWIFMISFLLTYTSSVGWSVLRQEENLVTGEDFDFSFFSLGVVGPFYILRDLFANIVEFIYNGIVLLVSQDARNEVLESDNDDNDESEEE